MKSPTSIMQVSSGPRVIFGEKKNLFVMIADNL